MIKKLRKSRKKIAIKREHYLVPRHELVKEDEEREILNDLMVEKEQLPKINSYDPAIQGLEAKLNDIIKITRIEGREKNIYYRVVI